MPKKRTISLTEKGHLIKEIAFGSQVNEPMSKVAKRLGFGYQTARKIWEQKDGILGILFENPGTNANVSASE